MKYFIIFILGFLLFPLGNWLLFKKLDITDTNQYRIIGASKATNFIEHKNLPLCYIKEGWYDGESYCSPTNTKAMKVWVYEFCNDERTHMYVTGLSADILQDMTPKDADKVLQLMMLYQKIHTNKQEK